MWRLHNLWSGSTIFNIYPEALIGLGTLWSLKEACIAWVWYAVHISVAAYLVVQIAMVLLVALRCSISRPKASKARRVHLLLQKVAVVRVMDVRVVLQSLHQILWVIPLATIWLLCLSSCTCVEDALLVGRISTYHLSIRKLLDLLLTSLVLIGRPLALLPFTFGAWPLLGGGLVRLILLGVEDDLVDVVLRVLVRLLNMSNLGHCVGISPFIQLSSSIIYCQLFSVPIIPTIPIAECWLITPHKISIELVIRRNIRRMWCL